MFWVVQTDLDQENRRPDLLAALERFGIPHQTVSVSFQGELDPEVTHTGPIITNGSILLSKVAARRGWQPGSMLNDNFSYEVWHPRFRQHLLNSDAVFTTIGDLSPDLEEFFIRPVFDDKTFTGRVLKRSDVPAWVERNRLSADTRVLYAPAKRIGQEHRHYIVDGEVVTSSRYRLGGQPNQSPVVEPYIVEFARRMAAIWQPARAFVLDTYVAGDEVGIVEMGCLCNAGLYQADVQKLVMALDSMPVTP